MSNATATPVHQPGLESLSKSFEPAALEAHWGAEWEKRGYGVAGFRGTISAPAWSPDGRQLVVTLSREGGSQLYVIGADGEGVRRLTQCRFESQRRTCTVVRGNRRKEPGETQSNHIRRPVAKGPHIRG